MELKGKKASESFTIMSELVFPNDTNGYGNLMGGRLMFWMDVAAAIAAGKHCNTACMTAGVDNLSFHNPIKLSNIVHVHAQVSRAFNSSMEIYIKVWGEDLLQQYKYESNEAYFTFVALDPNRRPRPVPPLIPETDEEIALYEGALKRRQIRLLLGGKLKVEDIPDMNNFFKNTLK